MDIQIIYEDDDFLIIDKPSGLLTHPVNRQDKSESVVSWVLEKHPEISKIRDDYGDSVGVWTDLRPGIVHRLDRETSGLLLIAKNQSSFNYLKNIFKERKIKKTYLALVYGIVKESSGTIDIPLGKLGSKQSTKIKGKKNLEEKSAITEFKVLQKFNDYSLIEFRPLTGRTHQLRVHAKTMGYPIVCDPIYSGKRAVCPPELGRMFLHANKLSFTSPSGMAISVEIDLPAKLDDFLKDLPKQEN